MWTRLSAPTDQTKGRTKRTVTAIYLTVPDPPRKKSDPMHHRRVHGPTRPDPTRPDISHGSSAGRPMQPAAQPWPDPTGIERGINVSYSHPKRFWNSPAPFLFLLFSFWLPLDRGGEDAKGDLGGFVAGWARRRPDWPPRLFFRVQALVGGGGQGSRPHRRISSRPRFERKRNHVDSTSDHGGEGTSSDGSSSGVCRLRWWKRGGPFLRVWVPWAYSQADAKGDFQVSLILVSCSTRSHS